MTKGDLVAAVDHNVLVVALAPIAIAWWLAWFLAERRGRPMPRLRLPKAAWIALIAVVTVFSVVRNLPFAAYFYSDLS